MCVCGFYFRDVIPVAMTMPEREKEEQEVAFPTNELVDDHDDEAGNSLKERLKQRRRMTSADDDDDDDDEEVDGNVDDEMDDDDDNNDVFIDSSSTAPLHRDYAPSTPSSQTKLSPPPPLPAAPPLPLPIYDDHSISYRLQYLGSSLALQSGVTGSLGPLQRPLRDLYFRYQQQGRKAGGGERTLVLTEHGVEMRWAAKQGAAVAAAAAAASLEEEAKERRRRG